MTKDDAIAELRAMQARLGELITVLEGEDGKDPYAGLSPVQRLIFLCLKENPQMPYDEIARAVRESVPGAKTTHKSVAATVYNARKDARLLLLLPEFRR